MECIFCKIVKGEIPSFKVWEDEKHIAILDIFPNTKGMTLLIPKKHYDSYAFDMPDDAYSETMLAAKRLGKKLDKALGTKRTALVMEGLGIDHLHIKLYPIYGLENKFEEISAKERKFFKKYEGYISTVLGPEANKSELAKLSEELRRHWKC